MTKHDENERVPTDRDLHGAGNLEAGLEGIRRLLSHLHSEVTTLEESYNQVVHGLRKLEAACNVDDLTGCLRRRPFFQRLQIMLDECRRTNESCGILMIDIDHFKRINDTHGHPTGDEVIRQIASLLKQYESPDCIVGRYGGEEFAVAVRGSEAEIIGLAEFIRRGAERLHGRVDRSKDASGRGGEPSTVLLWKCTLSVGVASARKQGFDAPRLLSAADQALYLAKHSGRNQVRAAG